MRKVVVANINSELGAELKKGNHHIEFELTEINKHLSDGWSIIKYDIVNTAESLYSFSIVYVLEK
jgi:hypothetical protein